MTVISPIPLGMFPCGGPFGTILRSGNAVNLCTFEDKGPCHNDLEAGNDK